MNREQFWENEVYRKECLDTPVLCLGELGEPREHDQVEVELCLWEDPDGHVFVPVFTDLSYLEEVADQDESYLEMPLSQIILMVQAETIIINPESDEEFVIAPDELTKLRNAQ